MIWLKIDHRLFQTAGFLLMAVLLLSGFSFFTASWSMIHKRIAREFPQVEHITSEHLVEMLESKELLLVDVRTKEEFEVSTIQNAVNLERPEDITVSQERMIVVFCSVGYRSAVIANALQKNGYNNVYNLRGSIFEWANRGYPLYQGLRLTSVVHPYNKYWGALLQKRFHSYTPTHH